MAATADMASVSDHGRRSQLGSGLRRVPRRLTLPLTMDAIDAYRCAKLLLDQHGQDADLQAAMRVDELGEAGDEAGRRAWLAIIAAIDELRRTAPGPAETVQ